MKKGHKVVDPKDIELPFVEVVETGYMNEDGYWVRRLTPIGSKDYYDFTTPYRECPYVVKHYWPEFEWKRKLETNEHKKRNNN